MKMMRLGHIPTDDTNDMENIRPCNGHGDQTTNQLAMKSWIWNEVATFLLIFNIDIQ